MVFILFLKTKFAILSIHRNPKSWLDCGTRCIDSLADHGLILACAIAMNIPLLVIYYIHIFKRNNIYSITFYNPFIKDEIKMGISVMGMLQEIRRRVSSVRCTNCTICCTGYVLNVCIYRTFHIITTIYLHM